MAEHGAMVLRVCRAVLGPGDADDAWSETFLAALRVKPGASLVPARDWWTWLYADPFENNETGYTAGLIGLNADDFPRNGRAVEAIAEEIRHFHAGMVQRLARGQAGVDLIPA